VDDLLPFLIGSSFRKFIIVNMSKNPLLVVSRRNLLLVVSTSTTRGRSDSLTNSSPYMSVDLEARSLVGGVDCNGPEKSPFRFDCSFIFVHHHALSPCMFSQSKLFFLKPILLFHLYGFIIIFPILSYSNPSSKLQ
jgi:hypothetical protein